MPANAHFKIPALDLCGQPAYRWREITLHKSRNVKAEDFLLYLTRNRNHHFDPPQNTPQFGFIERGGSPGFVCKTRQGIIYHGFSGFASQANVIDVQWSRMNKGCYRC